MSITNKDLEGKSIKQQKDLIRKHHPEIIRALRRQAKKELEESGQIRTKLEGIVRRSIQRKAGTLPKK